MAQRFHFDLQNGQSTICDDIGVEARDLEQAIREAQVVIEEMLENKTLSEVDAGWVLIVRDAAGEALLTMPVFSHPTESVEVS